MATNGPSLEAWLAKPLVRPSNDLATPSYEYEARNSIFEMAIFSSDDSSAKLNLVKEVRLRTRN
jgi:hypothetical protein